jgi:hypothetical protein
MTRAPMRRIRLWLGPTSGYAPQDGVAPVQTEAIEQDEYSANDLRSDGRAPGRDSRNGAVASAAAFGVARRCTGAAKAYRSGCHRRLNS